MKMKIYLLTLLALLLTFMTACEEEEGPNVFEEQEKRYFDLYISANYSELNPIEEDFYYISEKTGTGALPDSGDYLLINYVTYIIPDEVVVDTYMEEWAVDHGIYNASVMYGPYKFMHGAEIEGMRKGLAKMQEGGIARLLFKSDLGYGAEGDGGSIKSYKSLMFDIELLEVIDDVYARELAQIDAYLDTIQNEVAIYDAETEATMYYIPGEVGTGDTIGVDSQLEIFYTGQLLDGREFDSNIGQNSGFDVTIGEESVIAGWELGLKEFKYGGSGRLLIPHQLAYGVEGKILSGTKYGIPPVEALLFDISVEEKEEDIIKE